MSLGTTKNLLVELGTTFFGGTNYYNAVTFPIINWEDAKLTEFQNLTRYQYSARAFSRFNSDHEARYRHPSFPALLGAPDAQVEAINYLINFSLKGIKNPDQTEGTLKERYLKLTTTDTYRKESDGSLQNFTKTYTISFDSEGDEITDVEGGAPAGWLLEERDPSPNYSNPDTWDNALDRQLNATDNWRAVPLSNTAWSTHTAFTTLAEDAGGLNGEYKRSRFRVKLKVAKDHAAGREWLFDAGIYNIVAFLPIRPRQTRNFAPQELMRNDTFNFYNIELNHAAPPGGWIEEIDSNGVVYWCSKPALTAQTSYKAQYDAAGVTGWQDLFLIHGWEIFLQYDVFPAFGTVQEYGTPPPAKYRAATRPELKTPADFASWGSPW